MSESDRKKKEETMRKRRGGGGGIRKNKINYDLYIKY